ncbi:MAG: GLPGLI family protein [Lutibacter sp.]|nr:GLPGLI family protein [Lutibacter sp.]
MARYILIIILVLTINQCFSQNNIGIVIYKKQKLNYLSESDSFKENNKERVEYAAKVEDMDKNSKKALEEIDFKLVFKENRSSFSVVSYLEITESKYAKLAIGASGRGIYYTNFREEKCYREVNSYGENFIIKFPKWNWNLTNEIKTIGDYTCYKATSVKEIFGREGIVKKEVTAWYAPDLNIPFGPLEFNGLPGLIIELTVGKERYLVNKIELNSKMNIEILEPTKGKFVTKKEFDEIGVNMMQSYKKLF